MNMLPPSFVQLRMSAAQPSRHEQGPRVWLPVFLLWPLWLLALALFCLVLLVVTAATGSRAFRASLAATRELHRLACGLRGVQCEVRGARGQLRVSLI